MYFVPRASTGLKTEDLLFSDPNCTRERLCDAQPKRFAKQSSSRTERTRLVRDGLSSFLKQHVTRDITTCSFEAGPGVIEFVKLSFYQRKHEYKCVLKTLWELGWLSACKRTSWHGYPPLLTNQLFLIPIRSGIIDKECYN